MQKDELDYVLKSASHLFDHYQVSELQNSRGFVLWKNKKKETTSNWFVFDIDDTILATTETKKLRDKKVNAYLQKHISDSDLESKLSELLLLADRKARWVKHEGQDETYHHKAHMAHISWIQTQLQAGISLEDVCKSFEKELFTYEEAAQNLELEHIFVDTMVSAPMYSEIQEIMHLLISEKTKAVTPGVFTYGEPYFQLLKIKRLVETNPRLHFDSIFLSTVKKGEFLASIAKELPQFFDAVNICKFIMFDDDPNQLQSIKRAHESGKDKLLFPFHPVRVIQHGIKDHLNVTCEGELVVDFREQNARKVLRQVLFKLLHE